MLKFILLAICFVAYSKAYSQLEQKAYLIGGAFNIQSHKEGQAEPSSTFYVAPSLGKFITSNLAIGAEVVVAAPFKANRHAYKTLGGGIFARRYFSLIGSVYGIVQSNLGYTHQWVDIHQAGFSAINRVTERNAYLSLSPGLVYTVSRNVHLELLFSNLLGASFVDRKSKTIEGTATSVDKQQGLHFQGNSNDNLIGNSLFGIRFLIPSRQRH